MDGSKIDLVTLVSVIIFIVALFKLRSVLGRRTTDDEERIDRARAMEREQAAARESRPGAPASDAGNVVDLPRRNRDTGRDAGVAPPPVSVAEAEGRIKAFPNAEPVAVQGLLDILRYDSDFTPDAFVKGAKQAYEMIVTAFAEGNRKVLKDLLSKEVFDGFSHAITDRESRGEVMDQSFVGIGTADIAEAGVKNGIATITIRFVSQLISATRDRAGVVVGGDPQRIKEVTDVWTFSRDVSTAKARQDLNWRLIATQAAG